MRRLILLVVFLSSIVSAQGVPLPPKPKEDGSSLEVTMKFIQDKLNGQGAVNYLSTEHNSENNSAGKPTSNSFTISDADASAAACMLSFRYVQDVELFHADGRYEFSFLETEKLIVSPRVDTVNKESADHGYPETTYEFVPSVFSLRVKMLQGKQIRGRRRMQSGRDRQLTTESEESTNYMDLLFRDEEIASRVAKAMLRAIELCGGGSKDPF